MRRGCARTRRCCFATGPRGSSWPSAFVSPTTPNYAPLRLAAGTAPNFARDYPRLPRRTLLAKTVGVHPDFRQQQLMSYLGAYGMASFREFYDEIIFCLMRSDNFSRHFTDGLSAEVAQYALFERELAGALPQPSR